MLNPSITQRYLSMLTVLLFISCQQHNSPSIENNSPIEPAIQTVPEENPLPSLQEVKNNSKILGTTGMLETIKEEYTVADPIDINYLRQYPNGCFEQQEVSHNVTENTITHTLRVIDHSSEGKYCSLAIIPGGFTHQITDLQAGEYNGQILMNEELQLEYTISVTEVKDK
jgi:hypothetical protein